MTNLLAGPDCRYSYPVGDSELSVDRDTRAVQEGVLNISALGVPILSDYSGRSGRLGACHAIGCRMLNLPILLCSGGENVDCRTHARRKRRDSLLEER